MSNTVLYRSNVKMYEVKYGDHLYRLILSVPAHTYELYLAETTDSHSDDPYDYVSGYKLITTGAGGCGDSDEDVLDFVKCEVDYYHDCLSRHKEKTFEDHYS